MRPGAHHRSDSDRGQGRQRGNRLWLHQQGRADRRGTVGAERRGHPGDAGGLGG